MTAGRRNTNTLSKHWGTPKKYVDSVRHVFGTIHLDPCSNEWSIVNAETEWSLPNDGLKETWNFPTIYVNPPYGSDPEKGTRILHWLRKCLEANKLYSSQIIALVPVATNTLHWKECIWKQASSICFLYDTRLRFLEQGIDRGNGAPMACAAIYWGNNTSIFEDVFACHGAIVRTV